MKKIIFATKYWEKTKKSWVDRPAPEKYLEALQVLLKEDITGYGFSEVMQYYNEIYHFTLLYVITEYMQLDTLLDADYYFSLGIRAHQTARNIAYLNPHRSAVISYRKINLGPISQALLTDLSLSAIDLLEVDRKILCSQPEPKDKCQIALKKQSLLEIDLYEGLIQGDDEMVYQALDRLEKSNYDPLQAQVIHALLEQDTERFLDTLIQQLRRFRSCFEPDMINDFTLLMEKLYLNRQPFEPLNVADAPPQMLTLPSHTVSGIEEKLGASLPTFHVNEILPQIDPEKISTERKMHSVR